MLIHEIRSSGFWGKMTTLRDHFENSEKIMKTLTTFIANHSKISIDELPEILSRDRNYDVQECVEKGLVDEIIPSKIT